MPESMDREIHYCITYVVDLITQMAKHDVKCVVDYDKLVRQKLATGFLTTWNPDMLHATWMRFLQARVEAGQSTTKKNGEAAAKEGRGAGKSSGGKPTKALVYFQWNAGKCSKKGCKYAHECSNGTGHKQRAGGSQIDMTSIGTRGATSDYSLSFSKASVTKLNEENLEKGTGSGNTVSPLPFLRFTLVKGIFFRRPQCWDNASGCDLNFRPAVPKVTEFADRWAVVFQVDPAVDDLVRSVSLRAGWKFNPDSVVMSGKNYVKEGFDFKVDKHHKEELTARRVVLVPEGWARAIRGVGVARGQGSLEFQEGPGDALSRQEWQLFYQLRTEWLWDSVWRKDTNDRQLLRRVFRDLDDRPGVGQFSIDACCDESGSNAQTTNFWTVTQDCLQHDWEGHNAWCNSPFSRILEILQHFLECKRRQNVGTAACFVIPVWPTAGFFKFIEARPTMFFPLANVTAKKENAFSGTGVMLKKSIRFEGRDKMRVMLQDLPEGMESLTDSLIESELFTVSYAGALALGTWPEAHGAWATRKTAEAEKFSDVSAWAQAFGGPKAAAAAIAVTLRAKLDAFGERLSTLEAQRAASGGAGLHGGGAAPTESVLLRSAIRDSVATVEDWDIARCSQACTNLVHEAARLRPQLGLLRDVHPFGKAPMKSLEAHAFEPLLVYVLPALQTEECELDELPAGQEATVEHWRAFVHLLQARVGEFQRFVKSSQVPSFTISDVMLELTCTDGQNWEAALLEKWKKTVNEEQLARALRGELAPEDVTRPPGSVHVEARLGGAAKADGAGGCWWGQGQGQSRARAVVVEAAMAAVAAVEVCRMHVTGTTKATAGISRTAISGMSVVCAVLMDMCGATPRAQVGCGPPDVEDGRGVPPVPPSGADIPGGCHPAETWTSTSEPWRTTCFGEMAGAAGGDPAAGDCRAHGGMRHERGCAACGAGWPSEEIAIDKPYRVPNYVGPEHMEMMREELRRESEVGHIFLAGWRLPLGVIALGMVEKVCNGKVKFRPVSDYSRPADVGVNARIELEHDEFTTVKEAYGMLQPGYWMVKVDMEAAYKSVGIASMFWPHRCFVFDDVRWMDARAPFRNRALPGIFMRWTRAIVAWMRARGILTVGYLDDFFCVLETREQAEEAMMLLIDFDTSGGVCTASIDEERIAVVVRQAGNLKAQAVYNGRKVVLERHLVDERHLATDASGTLGFGGVWERLFFMLSWADLARLPQRPWFPRRADCPSSWSINYLELFAVWGWLGVMEYD
ncbi:hypothetical protein CYMTET_36958 [Cymbomonas tetramitiformis]|uniref:Uncharacterized protein n=1 Tax=Cymbomonas tetramitiformis TaxID=36881 RepID=A0AAE0F6Y1_9CHLO|nr:hypothetical protein CYMTET_36958 [Cymbomonas tetramitiformis]